MSYHDSSRAKAHKEERAKQKYTVGSSGTSATARARDARRDAALAEMGITTTTAADVAKEKAKQQSGSGYVPTYGPNSLYTSDGNTDQSAAGSAGGVASGSRKKGYGGRTTVGANTNYSGGTGGKSSGGARIYSGTGAGAAVIRSGMSDYDIQLRQNYNDRKAAITAANEAKKANYFQAMEEQTQADHDKRVKQLEDEIKELTAQSIPIAQRATSENAHGSRHHNKFLQNQIDDAKIELDRMGGANTAEKVEQDEAQTRERKWYDTVLDMANHAAGLTVTGVTGLVDGLANTVPTVEGILMGEDPDATFTGQLLRPITTLTGKLNDWAVNETNGSAQRWQDDLADESPSKQWVGNKAFSIMAAAPAAAAAILTKGASLGGTTMSASGAPVLNGAGNVSLGTQVMDKVIGGIKNPGTILTGFQDFGAGKSEAMANGATESEANTAGLMEATRIL